MNISSIRQSSSAKTIARTIKTANSVTAWSPMMSVRSISVSLECDEDDSHDEVSNSECHSEADYEVECHLRVSISCHLTQACP